MDRPRSDEPATNDLSEVLTETQGPVRRFLNRVVGAERADDVTSDTMLKLLEYAGARHVRRPVSFALRVAWNKAVDLIRRDAGRPDRANPEALAAASAPDRARVVELRDWLNTGLAKLSQEERALLQLRYEQDLSYREISRSLGLPVGTVGRRLHDARQRLARVLKASDERSALPIVLAFLPALRPHVTTLAEALGTTGAEAGRSLALRSWWIMAMSKKVAVAAFLLIGAGGVAWWLMRPADAGARVDVAPPAVSTPEVAAAPRGAAPAPGPIEAKPFAATESVTEVAPWLNGRVLDPDGKPVAGARVHVAARGTGPGFDVDAPPEDAGPRRAATSAADGRFSIDVTGLGSAFDLTATASGFAPAIREEVALSGPPVEIWLGRGLTFTGLVRDLQEKPVAGATLTFRGLAGRGRLKTCATTDAAGRFTLGPAPEISSLTLGAGSQGTGPSMGEAHILVVAEGFAPQRVGVTGSPMSLVPASTDLDIHLTRGGIVTGVVTEAAGGAPVADAEVVLWTMEGMTGTRSERGVIYRNPFGSRIIARTKTDASGAYRFDHAPAQLAGIRLLSSSSVGLGGGRTKLGGVAAHRQGFAPAGLEVGTPLAEGESQTVNLSLRPAATVMGRVVDDAGQPVAGVRVFCLSDVRNAFGAGNNSGGLVPGDSSIFGGTVLSDADGRFRHEAAPVAEAGGRSFIYACGCDLGLPKSQTQNLDFTAGGTVAVPDLVIARQSTIPIEGEVRDEQGRPLAGARVVWGVNADRAQRGLGLSPLLVTFTDRVGAFRLLAPAPPDPSKPKPPLSDLMPDERRVTVMMRGKVTQVVDPPARGERLLVTLAAAAPITGIVERVGGDRVEGASVRAVPASLDSANVKTLWDARALAVAQTDGAGRFTLDGPADAVTVVASVSGEGMVIAVAGPVTAPARDVRLLLPVARGPEGLMLTVNVIDETTGAPWTATVSGTLSRFSDAGWPPLFMSSGTVDGPGKLRFRGLTEGVYDLRIDSPNFAPWVAKGFVVDKKSVANPVEVRLGGGAAIDGAVVLPSAGSPLEYVDVTAYGPKGEMVQAITGGDGKFRLRGIGPGAWELLASRFRPNEKLVTAQPIGVTVGTTAPTVQVPLIAATETTVTVKVMGGDPGTRPAIGPMMISLEDAKGRRLSIAHPDVGENGLATVSLWSAPGAVKAVVRSGPQVLASVEGMAGGNLRLSVTLD